MLNRNGKEQVRQKRATDSDQFSVKMPVCKNLMQTSRHPFVVILLYKTSGRFLGLGSIVDKKTVITASEVVKLSLSAPSELLILAGYLSPYWGPDSQVKKAEVIYALAEIAIITINDEFEFNNNVRPIKLPHDDHGHDFRAQYGNTAAVFGLQRTAIDSPGQYVLRGSIYSLSYETIPETINACLTSYRDQDFNSSTMFCTFANGSWSWGCLGSPSVMQDKLDRLFQVGVVIKTTVTDDESYHFHIRIAPFVHWIRAHSLLSLEHQ